MLNDPAETEAPQIRRLHEWWLQLPMPYRVNALLYFVGGLLAVFLLYTLFAGGDSSSRRIQVGSGATGPTSTAKRNVAAPAPTVAAPTSSSPSPTGPTTSMTNPLSGLLGARPAGPALGPSSSGGDAGSAPAPNAVAEPPGGGGGGGEGTTTTTTATTTTTTIEIKPCRNSQEPRCGAFSWDPPAGPDRPLTIEVKAPNPKVGEPAVFKVTVVDPDHPVSDYCSEVRFGDGVLGDAAHADAAADGGCSPPPTADCPHFGPWTPPPRQPGVYQREYTHTYTTAATYTVTFTFRSVSKDRCLAVDPYASESTRTVDVTVAS